MTTTERILSICKDRGIPIYRLEKACGFSNAYISRLKKGFIPDEKLSLIADYLGLSMDFLKHGEAGDADPPPPESKEIEMLLMEARKAEPADVRIAIDVLRSLNAKRDDQMRRLKEYVDAFGKAGG